MRFFFKASNMKKKNFFNHFSELPEAFTGKITHFFQDFDIQHLLTDSRKITFPENSLFFAIKGERHDGHDFISEAYGKGVRGFVVEKTFDWEAFPQANVFEVKSSIAFIQQLAAYRRRWFLFPVVGITGSNGKTIVKEWIDSLLGRFFNIVKSPKSYNSQIGVPLSVWQINQSHNLGVFEAGISSFGDMDSLQKVIQPTIGLFTNIGTAHDEGFKNREQKIQEKLKLFRDCETIIYCLDHTEIHHQIQHTFDRKFYFTWGRNQPEANLNLLEIRRKKGKTRLFLKSKNINYGIYAYKYYELDIPFTDEASLENLMHCLTLALCMRIDLDLLKPHLKLLKTPSMRLELKQGLNSCYLINDAYSNDFAGFTIALDFLNQQNQRSRKTVILSDVLQSGMPEQVLYKNISDMLKSYQVSRLIGIGEVISRNRQFFKDNSEFFPDTQTFLEQGSLAFSRETILIKGARTFRFEEIVNRLEQKTHGTVLEINLDAVAQNLNYFRSKLQPETKVMAMVKAFAYGSGSNEIANLLQFHRVDYLSVAYADEGAALRENGIYLPIMVLNPVADTFEQLLKFDLEPNIYSFDILDEVLDFLRQNRKKLSLHISFDTGMHRLGFEEEDLPALIEKITHHSDFLNVASFYTHLAAADDLQHREFTLLQLQQFQKWAQLVSRYLDYRPLLHALNTPGISYFPDHQMDMIRLGAGLYGIGANDQEKQSLSVVSTLKTTISQIKHLKAGETVGYGRRGKVDSPKSIATIAIGYADGFSRRLSNGVGKVLVAGQLCPVIGSVCMDMAMVDITQVAARVGDEVLIFGENPTVYDLSESLQTIPYELLAGINERVKRVFYTE
jgi:alanine racemase